MECKNPKVMNNAHVAEMSEDEAWDLLKKASDERDIGDFKEAVQVLSKVAPDYTYPRLEKQFRKRGFNIYLIAMVSMSVLRCFPLMLSLSIGEGSW